MGRAFTRETGRHEGPPPPKDTPAPTLLLGLLIFNLVLLSALFLFDLPRKRVQQPLPRHSLVWKKVIEGRLVPGSLCMESDGRAYRFRLQDEDTRVEVRGPSCKVPVTLQRYSDIELELSVLVDLDPRQSLGIVRHIYVNPFEPVEAAVSTERRTSVPTCD